jgi:hypothetical protein
MPVVKLVREIPVEKPTSVTEQIHSGYDSLRWELLCTVDLLFSVLVHHVHDR